MLNTATLEKKSGVSVAPRGAGMPKLKSSSVGGAGVCAAKGGAEGAVEMPSVWLGVGEEEGVMEGVGV